MAGIFDMFDPEVVKAMQGFGPSEADRQRAMNMGLLSAGLGVLAGNRGYGRGQALSNAIGQGGLMGMGTYQQQLNDAERDQMRQLQMAQMAQGMVQQQRQREALKNAPQEVQQAVSMGVPISEIWKRQNPERKLETIYDPSGREIKGYVDFNTGRFTPIGGAKSGVTAINLGGKTVFVDPAMMSGKALPHTMAPGDAASLGLQRERFEHEKTQAGKPQFNAELGGFYVPPADMAPGETRKVEGLQKPLTEAQGKAAGFADRMMAAEKILSDPSYKETVSPAEAAISSLPIVGDAASNVFRSANRQQYVQAQEDWVRAKLRKESGAVIGADEMRDEVRTYFPQVGDSPAVIAQKAEARRTAMQGIGREAGATYKQQEAPKARSKQFDISGRKVVGQLGEDGNYYVTQAGVKYRVEE